jgi:hypothetical protein
VSELPHDGTDMSHGVRVVRYGDAPVAAIMNDFYWNVFGVSRATPYPAQEMTKAMAAIPGFAPVLSPNNPYASSG